MNPMVNKIKTITILTLLTISVVKSHRIYTQTTTTGAIEGYVYDADGSARTGLKGALVTAINQDTDIPARARTDEFGHYVIYSIASGKYSIKCELDGYENLSDVQQDFLVIITRTSPVRGPIFTMRKLAQNAPASAAQASAAKGSSTLQPNQLAETISATRGGSFTDQEITALPLRGIRSFDSLALLLPGVAPAPETISSTPGPGMGASVGTAGQFSVNGLPSRGNNFTIDGSENFDEDIGVRRQGFVSLVPQAIESVAEYQVITSLANPQFGRGMGGMANAVSKLGGSKFHGTVYGFFNDRRLNARDFFSMEGNTLGPSVSVLQYGNAGQAVNLDGHLLTQPNPVPERLPGTRSQAGVVLGGPLGKSTQIFGSFEHQDINAVKQADFAVPTVDQRGIFGKGATGLAIGGIPAYPTTSIGDSVFSIFPWPNNPLGPYGANTRTEVIRSNSHGVIGSFKIDRQLHFWGNENFLRARYNISDDQAILPVTGQSLYSTLKSNVRTQNASIIWDFVHSNRTANQARFSYGRTALDIVNLPSNSLSPPIGTPGNSQFQLTNVPLIYNGTTSLNSNTVYRSYQDWAQVPGAQNLFPYDGSAGVLGPLGRLVVSGFSGVGYDVFNFPQNRVNNTFQFADILFLNLGSRHRLTIGVDLSRSQLNSLVERNSRSMALFGGTPNLNPNLKDPNGGEISYFRGADFAAVGSATGFFQTLNGPNAFGTIGMRFLRTDFFAADQIRVNPKLILTIGTRYSLPSVPVEVNHRIEDSFQSADVKQYIALEKGYTGVSGLEKALDGRTQIQAPDHNNIAPYFGFAWNLSDRSHTSLRGGYGIYYDQIPGVVISQSRNVFPNFLALNTGGYLLYDPRYDFEDSLTLKSTNPYYFAEPGSVNTFNTSFAPSGIPQFMADMGIGTHFGSGPAFVLPEYHLKTLYAQQWALTLDQELHHNWLLSVAYTGTRGLNLLRFSTPNLGSNSIPIVSKITVNSLVPSLYGYSVSPGTSLVAGNGTLGTNGRPYPLLGSFTSIVSDSSSIYHSLQVHLLRRFAKGLQFSAAYTWSHAIDQGSDLFDLAGSVSLPQDSFNLRAERANASYDARHRFVNSLIWDIPLFTSSRLWGGWQISEILAFSTGRPFTIYTPYDVNLDGNLSDRLNGTGGLAIVNQGPLRFTFPEDQALAQLAPVGTNGQVGRNVLWGPQSLNADLALTKRFRLKEHRSILIRTECYNFLNHANFGVPVHQLLFPSLGRSANTVSTPRAIQFSIKFAF
jgi:hypothetical protein